MSMKANCRGGCVGGRGERGMDVYQLIWIIIGRLITGPGQILYYSVA